MHQSRAQSPETVMPKSISRGVSREPIGDGPVPIDDRATVLDVLRGLALLGILVNNIYGFSGYGYLTSENKQLFTTFPIDHTLDFLQTLLIEGKFYSIFSLLFGIGFSIILTRSARKSKDGLILFYKRLIILMFIGAGHLYFFWEGDILLLYAVLGLFLPLFRSCSDRVLLTWASLLILSPIAVELIKNVMDLTPAAFLRSIGEPMDIANGITDDNWRDFLFAPGNGWANWRAWQESAWAHRYYYLIDSNRPVKVLGVFILGLYAGRKMIYAKLTEHKALFRKILTYGFAIGLPANAALAYLETHQPNNESSFYRLMETITYAVGVVPLALAYAAFVALLFAYRPNRFSFFAPAGRMALTTYLMQTLICVFLFYSVGLGFGQQLGLTWLFPIAVLIYACQIVFSRLWFRRFDFGPVEWVWRQLTYGKRLPLRKMS